MAFQKPEAPAPTPSSSTTAAVGASTTPTTSRAAGWLKHGINLTTKFLDSRQDTHQFVSNVRDKFRHSLRDADFSDELKAFGGNPLHWARGANALQVVKSGIEANLPVNACNKLGQTPLHVHCAVAAESSSLAVIVTLLAHEADPLQADNEGNTPLHIACKHANVDAAKLLIVFGASVSARNRQGLTVWDMARDCIAAHKEALWRVLCVGDHIDEVAVISEAMGNAAAAMEITTARSALELQLQQLDGWRPFNDKCMLFENEKGRKGDKLLTLDGGGMRGLILIILLMELEMLSGRAVQDTFDWLAGTSTGGILALALCSGKSLYHCLCLYLRLKNLVFSDAKPHVLRNLETLLQQEFGTEMRMSDLPRRPRVMIATALADRNPPTLHLFRNYINPNVDSQRETSCVAVGEDGVHVSCGGVINDALHGSELVWKAARNTALAPTYFIQLDSDENFMDGGVMANNPTMAACTEITKFYTSGTEGDSTSSAACPLKLVVSLGTGKQPARYMAVTRNSLKSPQAVVDTTLPVANTTANQPSPSLVGNVSASIFRDFSTFASGYVNATHLAVAQLTDSEGLPVEYTRTLCRFGRVSFFRFSPQLERFVELDCIDDAVLANVMWQAKAYVRLGRKADELLVLANFIRSISSSSV